jgi:hypothetical protein
MLDHVVVGISLARRGGHPEYYSPVILLAVPLNLVLLQLSVS